MRIFRHVQHPLIRCVVLRSPHEPKEPHPGAHPGRAPRRPGPWAHRGPSPEVDRHQAQTTATKLKQSKPYARERDATGRDRRDPRCRAYHLVPASPRAEQIGHRPRGELLAGATRGALTSVRGYGAGGPCPSRSLRRAPRASGQSGRRSFSGCSGVVGRSRQRETPEQRSGRGRDFAPSA
jgi:hypothetical protein